MMASGIACNRIGLLLICAGLSLTLWSCLSGPAPSDHYYRIDAGVPDAPAAKKLPGNLQVDRLRADALTGERQLLYQETADAPEVHRYPYHRWSDAPAILIQVELVSFLEAAAAADSVTTATTRVKPDYVASGRIHRFERVLEPDPRAVVEIELVVTSAGGDEILVNRSYREERLAANATLEATAAAFSEAIHAIFERFLTDLGSAR
jgi:ABC-type uncharacterized transport system auxiliary subunit